MIKCTVNVIEFGGTKLKKLKVPEHLLLTVEKPSQYIGNEVNAIHKDLNDVDAHFALCFPDTYEIGMSHLGLSILYNLLNSLEGTYCERVFSPMQDMEDLMKGWIFPCSPWNHRQLSMILICWDLPSNTKCAIRTS